MTWRVSCFVAWQASESNTTVHVGNLIGTETEENMRNAFKEFGTIDNIRVPGKNFGFVAFTTHLAVSQSAVGWCHGGG